MNDLAVPCMLMRGGTSKGPIFLASDLPTDADARDGVLLSLMGSPDIRQINGIGGADALTSQALIAGPSQRDDAEIDYLFAQVAVAQRQRRARVAGRLRDSAPRRLDRFALLRAVELPRGAFDHRRALHRRGDANRRHDRRRARVATVRRRNRHRASLRESHGSRRNENRRVPWGTHDARKRRAHRASAVRRARVRDSVPFLAGACAERFPGFSALRATARSIS